LHSSQSVSNKLLLVGLCLMAVSPVASMGQTQTCDWALYKTIYVNGTAFFAPVVGIGGVPVALGFSHQSATPIINMYVDKNSYRRDGDFKAQDMAYFCEGPNPSPIPVTTSP